jgi:hypothetical protein
MVLHFVIGLIYNELYAHTIKKLQTKVIIAKAIKSSVDDQRDAVDTKTD